jgi:monoterpene epsilon-lactone hydrolase
MRDLTLKDRLWCGVARWVERPALALVAHQALLRWMFRTTARLTTGMPSGTQRRLDGNGHLWITAPGVAGDAPLIVYIHGGGFTIGGPETHAGLAAGLGAAAGMRVVLPRYRLAPEHPFPAARHDVIAAWENIADEAGTPVGLCGDSAGGCLALLLAMDLRDRGQPLPRALGLIAPIADLSSDIALRMGNAPGEILIPPAWPRRIMDAYLAGTDPADPAISPLLGDLRGLPPTLIQAGAGEALAEDGRRLVEAMDDASLDLWPGLQHVWQLHAGRAPAADAALADLGRHLAEHAG